MRYRADRPSWLTRIGAFGGLAFMHIPVLVIILYAFTTDDRTYRFPPPGLTMKWFEVAFGRADIWQSLTLSLGVAACATVIAMVLGTLAAFALARNETLLSRTHFARHLVERGAAKDIQNAFDRYLAKGKPAYVSHRWASLEDAVRWITTSGGTAVIAHPGRYGLKPMMRDEMLGQFKAFGGEAIEVVTGSHRPEQYAAWQRVALEQGFLASRGSDYHGPGESPHEPGTLPKLHASLTPVWSKFSH